MKKTTRTRTLIGLSVIGAMAIVAAACSAPQSQPPAASTEAATAQEQPAQPAQPAPSATAESASPAESVQPASRPAPAAAAPAPQPAVTPPPAPPKPRVANLAAGRALTIRTTRELSTKTMKTGDVFSAILEEPIAAGNWVVAPAGARVDGRIVEADKGGRVRGKANLSVELTSLTIADGRKIEIVTSPISSEAAASKGKDAKKIGIGAGAGAAVGAIAGGGQGAAIGALVGGGAGAALRGEAAEIPAETVLAFELRSPVTIQERK
jgi:hypothetical protein